MASHLHDSVLQTLALIQRNAQEPAEVNTLARRQGRELRTWLYGGSVIEEETVAGAMQAMTAAVEDQYRMGVELVMVGDAPMEDRTAALVGAAREAAVNAAKHAGVDSIDIFCEAREGAVEVFVRDRGPGFEIDAIPDDRQGVRISIIERMDRAGGSADFRTGPGGGTEVRLSLTQ